MELKGFNINFTIRYLSDSSAHLFNITVLVGGLF